jgi:hypothetical protein
VKNVGISCDVIQDKSPNYREKTKHILYTRNMIIRLSAYGDWIVKGKFLIEKYHAANPLKSETDFEEPIVYLRRIGAEVHLFFSGSV